MGAAGTSSPVEIEFAVNLNTPPGEPKEFAFLQLRPLSASRELDEIELAKVPREDLICESPSALGHGHLDNIVDMVVVDRNQFERAQSEDCARAVAHFNAELMKAHRPYILVGVGRWGVHPRLAGDPSTVGGHRRPPRPSWRRDSRTSG